MMSDLFETNSYLKLILNNFVGKKTHFSLNSAHVQILNRFAKLDSRKLLYSSLICISDAINGIENKRFSWSVVKLYYSTFYSFKAMLLDNGILTHYDGRSPYWIELRGGKHLQNAPVRAGASSHKLIFCLFEDLFPNSPLISQEIDGKSPYLWLSDKREYVNYKLARFYEPNFPEYMREICKQGARKLIPSYIENNNLSFDADHAILSYPIYALNYVINRRNGLDIDETEEFHSDLVKDNYFRDLKGLLPELIRIRKLL